MRDSNSISFQPSGHPFNSGRNLLVAFVMLIGFSGCSKLADQPLTFQPIAPPPSLNAQQNQNVSEILNRQDEMRIAALEKEAMAKEAEMAKEAAVAAKTIVNEKELASAQQDEIVNNAALRAANDVDESPFIEPQFGVALVGFETEVDLLDEQAFDGQTNSIAADTDQNAAPVRLTASVNDLGDTTQNAGGEEFLLAGNNLLRGEPAANEEPAKVELQATRVDAPPTAQRIIEVDPQTVAAQKIPAPLQFPLQPMLFNPATRQAKRSIEGTLRPLVNAPQQVEQTITLKSDRTSNAGTSRTVSSRLLRPIERTARLPDTSNSPQVAPNDFKAINPQPRDVAQPVIASKPIDFLTPSKPAEPVAFGPQLQGPIVDATLANANPTYLQTAPQTIPQNVVPPEVFQDAEEFAKDAAQELVANAIAVGPIEAPGNDFKVRTTSVSEHEFGQPLVANNDFAAPELPSGDFVPPMTVIPTKVPAVAPGSFKKVASQFGTPIALKAPPQADSFVARVAALPTVGGSNAIAKSSVPPVGIATLMELDSVTWKSRLDEAIELAQARLDQIKQPSDASLVNLRLLKALRGQMEQMETSNGQLPPSEARYWQHQLEAITSMLGTPSGKNQALTDYHRHQSAHKTLEHLRNAVSQLESIASLKVNSGQFCTEITGFGKFRTFDSNRFKAGQKMLVYCEVENYRTVEHQSAITAEFRTRLRGSFAIYDTNGRVVQQAEYPTVDDVARKRRRDFYMYMPVTLSNLPAGEYVLHALVEDVHGNKTASLDPPLPFSVE